MEPKSGKIDNSVFVHIVIFGSIALLVAGYVFLLSQIRGLQQRGEAPAVSTTFTFPTPAPVLVPVPTASAAPAATPQVVVQTVIKEVAASPAPSTKTTYIPLPGPYSTTNTTWTDVPGAQAYVDLKNNYSSSAYVTWEASLHVVGGGQITARIFDKTNGIEVLGSQVSTKATTSTLIISSKLNLWSGNNLYQVQIESLDSNTVTFDSGRIKIVYN